MIGKREHDAIEAAAQALFGFNKENNLVGWDIVPEEVREYHRECAEDAVVAALASLGFDELYFSARIGFDDDGIPLTELIPPINDAFALAEIHEDCPVECAYCGEILATTKCKNCNGGGWVGLGECEWCGGAGNIHEGCAWMTYDGLVAENEAMKSAIARVESLAENSGTTSRRRILKALEGSG